MEPYVIALLNVILGAAGGIGALAVAAFTSFGQRFMNLKFDERLEAYKNKLEGFGNVGFGSKTDVGGWTKTANYRRTEVAASFAATALQS
jgi:hypothetical protein